MKNVLEDTFKVNSPKVSLELHKTKQKTSLGNVSSLFKRRQEAFNDGQKRLGSTLCVSKHSMTLNNFKSKKSSKRSSSKQDSSEEHGNELE